MELAVSGELPVTQPWSMKLDPDERLTEVLKEQIRMALAEDETNSISFPRRLWFMGRPYRSGRTYYEFGARAHVVSLITR